jgi:SEC-C motif domain protein
MRCPCRKKSETIAFAACCGPHHAGERAAATAEALMRSRYTAFVLENADYLVATWHPSTRPETMGFTPEQEWLQLKIVGAHADGDKATVEFIARSRIGGANHVLHEVSRFVREQGQWLYVRGEAG